MSSGLEMSQVPVGHLSEWICGQKLWRGSSVERGAGPEAVAVGEGAPERVQGERWEDIPAPRGREHLEEPGASAGDYC